jgi:phosphomannomutase
MTQRVALRWQRWEAMYTVDFTVDALRRRCWRLANELAVRSMRCLVTHDTRFLSGPLAREAFQLLSYRGLQVKFNPTPVPLAAVELAVEQRRVDAAVVISAGNRPYWFNGLYALLPIEEQAILEPVELPPLDERPFPDLSSDDEQHRIDVRGPYLEWLRSLVDIDLIRRASLTLFVDAMNGPTSGYLPTLLGEGSQTRAVEINREPDPLFGRATPQPLESGVPRLRKLVRESDSHFGVAISADGRVVVATEHYGELVRPFELGLLLAEYQLKYKQPRGQVIIGPEGDYPWLANWITEHQVKVELLPQPGLRIAEVVARERQNLLVGVSETGEITLGKYAAAPDATLATLLLTEWIARRGCKLQQLVAELRTPA